MIIPIEYLIYGIGFLTIITFLYGYSKDKESSKKMHVLAKSVGELTRQMYESEMRFNEKIKSLEAHKEGMSSAEIETLVDISVTEKLIPINQTVGQMEQTLDAFSQEFAGRIVRLENSLKEASMARSSVGGADDKRILQLYKEGKDIETIARELRISNPEVEFALKLADLR